jgi:hypothetical protein
MKKMIVRINLHLLRNDPHAEFNTNMDGIFVKHLPQTPDIEPLYRRYRGAFDIELDALDYIRSSALTEMIIKKDHLRDEAYRGLYGSVKAFTHHYEPDFSAAALSLRNIFDFFGDLPHEAIDAKSAAIVALFRKLDKPVMVSALQLLGLTAWAEKLLEENVSFTDLIMERTVEEAHKTAHRSVAARRVTDRYYHAIVTRIELSALLGDAEAGALIMDMNPVIDRFKRILAQKRGRRKKRKKPAVW